LADYIDMHTHLLPGFDDGAEVATESMEILLQAWQAGFRTVVATPHMMGGIYEHDRASVNEAIAELMPEVNRQLPGMRLVPGSEYYLDDRFFEWLEQGALSPIGDGSHVLVELPMLKLSPMYKEFAFRMQIKGFIPILAHPERYADIARRPEMTEVLVDAGYLIQINLGSLSGFYGRRIRRAAEWMLKKRLVDFVGSDSHTPKQAAECFTEGMEVLRDHVGEAGMQRLLVDNPRRVIGGGDNG